MGGSVAPYLLVLLYASEGLYVVIVRLIGAKEVFRQPHVGSYVPLSVA